MEQYILNRFQSTPVFSSLTPEEQEQALIDAQTIIETAGDEITPFYEAAKSGKTFAYYAEQAGLTPDESGPCDDSIYKDAEVFIIYISTAGAIDCKYLALVARRGITPTQELANKDAISDYLDWVTTGDVCTYQFKDWDGEILKLGSLRSGETPEAPTDMPTRQGYDFTGWSPNVGPVTQDTTFVAQYTKRVAPTEFHTILDGLILGVGETVDWECGFSPTNAKDFSNISIIGGECYSGQISGELKSVSDGIAVYSVTGTDEGTGEIRLETTASDDPILRSGFYATSAPTFEVPVYVKDGNETIETLTPVRLSEDFTLNSINEDGGTLVISGIIGVGVEDINISIPCNLPEGYFFKSAVYDTSNREIVVSVEFSDSPVEFFALPGEPTDISMAIGETTVWRCGYTPTNATDFSGITIVGDCYEMYTSFTVSFENGVATLNITGTDVGNTFFEMYIDGVGTGVRVYCSVDDECY